MGTITKVEICKKNKNRVNIFVDDEFFMSSFLEVAYLNKLKVGVEIDEQNLKKLISDEEVAKANSYAIKLLSKFIKTEAEVKNKLQERGYSPETVEVVTKKLKEYGYINDKLFAENYKNTYACSKSKMVIKQQLKIKGVSGSIIDELQFDENSEIETATHLATKWLKNKEYTKENYFKLLNFLYGKGFSRNVCTKTLSKFFSENFDEIVNDNLEN